MTPDAAATDLELGPKSLLWRWAGDMRIGFMGPSIGLLQLMHPGIGAGVQEHSDFFDDPYDRVFRSIPWILGVVYDGPEAHDTGRQVRDFHRPVRGTDSQNRAYSALAPETFWWAHATFQHMVEQVADRFDRHRLTSAQREQLYQEGIVWYRRYGITDRVVPPDRAAFQRVWDTYCRERLEMNAAAERVLELIIDHRHAPKLPDELAWARHIVNAAPVRRWGLIPLRLAAIGGLPSIVRKRFGIPWSRADQAALNSLELSVRLAWPLVPFPLRWQPRALAGWRRARRDERQPTGAVRGTTAARVQ